MDNQWLLILLCAGAAGLVAMFVGQLFSGADTGKLRDRLKGGGKFTASAAAVKAQRNGIKNMAERIGQIAAEPFMPKTRETQSKLKMKLGWAGIHAPAAMRAMTGAKVIFSVSGVVAGYFVGSMFDYSMMGLALGGLAGYMLPMIWLKLRISGNQKALTYGLADALDLMVVCIEAGLTVDGSMQRVGQELALAHPALARELSITHMETRVGLSRSEAMKKLGSRTGNPAVQSLVAMLIQAERFGTSVAQALRVHAETLRANRQFVAEEAAAKASVKMSFPLVLFIFPSTFIVLAGPTIINLMSSDLFK